MDEKVFYVTTPIYYVNDVPHIGHAYCTMAADILARFWRQRGRKVFFLTGTDEHGQKVQKAAEAKGLSPKDHCDQMVEPFKALWERLNITNDEFIRTTERRHEEVVQKVFQKLYEKGDIYKGAYEGWYCVHEETYYPSSQIIDGKCPECQRPVQWLKEEAYFFACSRYQEKLLKHLEEAPDFIMPSFRYNEVKSFVESGIEDVCVSRNAQKVSWGIPVPFDPNHVVYVWFDALLNYLTGAYYLQDEEKFRSIWPADIHLIGKDILRFHAVIWPAMLLALELPLPRHIFATGFWTLGGEKISKSKGLVINPDALVKKYGNDAVRYFFFREISLGADGEFTEESLVRRLNFDLANDLGNFIHRTGNLFVRFSDGKVPTPGELTSRELEIEKTALEVERKLPELMSELKIKESLEEIWQLIREANRYVDQTSPWNLKDDHPEYLGTVLYTIAELWRWISLFIHPFLPQASEEIRRRLSLERDELFLTDGLRSNRLKPGLLVKGGPPLFPRRKE